MEACPSLHSRCAQKDRQGLPSEYATGRGARHPVCTIWYALTNTSFLFDQSLTERALAGAPDVAYLYGRSLTSSDQTEACSRNLSL